MDLAEVVKKYLELSGGYDLPLPLSRFGLPRTEVDRVFSAWDEDYQISRFMLLSRDEKSSPSPEGPFSINGCEYTHVAFRPGVEEFLRSA